MEPTCLCGGGPGCDCIPFAEPLTADEAARVAGYRDRADYLARREDAARAQRRQQPARPAAWNPGGRRA